MMISLFESFDLMNSSYISLNWLILMFIYLSFSYMYWLIPSRVMILWMLLSKLMFNEFNELTMKFESNILFFISLMFILMFLNFIGLFPYIFVMTGEMSFNLSMSLSSWLGFMIFMIYYDYKNFLCHLVPMNTPYMLMILMVIIEFISNLVRPLALAIRLMANMIAGHLLMILLGNFMLKVNLLLLLLMYFLLNLLTIMEIFVSFIQSYVFSMLMVLYYSESK